MGKEKGEMGFLDHLDALRWHIMRSVIAILVFSIVAFFMKDFVFGTLILGPSKPDFITYRVLCKLSEMLNTDALCFTEFNFKLQSRTMMGQFSMHLTASIVVGFVVAFPYVFWEMWSFVKPAMYSKERSHIGGIVFAVSSLFIFGSLFGYYVMSPISINFFSSYTVDDSIENFFDITNYVNTLVMLVLASGIIFQFPVVTYFLSKVGIVTPDFLRKYRKHAVVVNLIISAIITPPDPISQVMISFPILILYEISIWISVSVYKNKAKKLG